MGVSVSRDTPAWYSCQEGRMDHVAFREEAKARGIVLERPTREAFQS